MNINIIALSMILSVGTINVFGKAKEKISSVMYISHTITINLIDIELE